MRSKRKVGRSPSTHTQTQTHTQTHTHTHTHHLPRRNVANVKDFDRNASNEERKEENPVVNETVSIQRKGIKKRNSSHSMESLLQRGKTYLPSKISLTQKGKTETRREGERERENILRTSGEKEKDQN